MDNTIGDHVALTRLVDAPDGQSRFEAATLAYDGVLGPLRQSAVFETSAIRFGSWPGGYAGALPTSKQGQVVLVLEGAVRIEIGGDSRTFRSGDVLEMGQQSGQTAKVSAADGKPFRAAILDLGEAMGGTAGASKGQKTDRSLPFVRNATSDDQRSHFQDGALPYFNHGYGVLLTDDIAISRFQYVYAANDLRFEFHNAPQRQIVIPLTGGIEGENGDGTTCVIPIGGVYFGEDTTGEGHITKALNNSIRFSIFAHLV